MTISLLPTPNSIYFVLWLYFLLTLSRASESMITLLFHFHQSFLSSSSYLLMTPTILTHYPGSVAISDSDVLNVLPNLNSSKAMGPDGIPPIVLQKCATVLYQPLLFIKLDFSFHACHKTAKFTRSFSFSSLVTLPWWRNIASFPYSTGKYILVWSGLINQQNSLGYNIDVYY